MDRKLQPVNFVSRQENIWISQNSKICCKKKKVQKKFVYIGNVLTFFAIKKNRNKSQKQVNCNINKSSNNPKLRYHPAAFQGKISKKKYFLRKIKAKIGWNAVQIYELIPICLVFAHWRQWIRLRRSCRWWCRVRLHSSESKLLQLRSSSSSCNREWGRILRKLPRMNMSRLVGWHVCWWHVSYVRIVSSGLMWWWLDTLA